MSESGTPEGASEGVSGRGGCLCGAVRFETRGRLRPVVACHCGQCLRSHGNFAAYSAVPADRLTFVEDGGLAWYRSSEIARRGFCRDCGSSLFWARDGAGYVAVSAGSFDRPNDLRLEKHIFVEDKPAFYEITDGLEQFPRGMG